MYIVYIGITLQCTRFEVYSGDSVKTYRAISGIPCPKFGILGLFNQHGVFNCCRHAKDNYSKAGHLIKIVATQFFPCKD